MSAQQGFLVAILLMFIPVFLCGFAARDVFEVVVRWWLARSNQKKGAA